MVEGSWDILTALEEAPQEPAPREVAHILDLPAVLVVDARGASVSLAALIKGFLEFERPHGKPDKGCDL